MSIMFVKRSELPMPTRGKEATSHTVSISDGGQVTLNTLSTKFFADSPKVAMAFDGSKAYLFREDAPVVVKAIQGKKLGEKDLIVMRVNAKNHTLAFTASQVIVNSTKYGASVAYDFKASGNQTFEATVDEKNKAITFELPESGKLVPKPHVRAKKVKAAATVANPASQVGTPVTSEELVLDAA